MIEDDNLTAVAGETAGDVVNPSEDAAKAASEKDITSPPTEEGGAKEATAEAGEDAGDKPKKLSGSARKAERIRELETRIAELEQRSNAAPEADKPPKFEDFPDWDAYEQARTQHAVKMALKEAGKANAASELDSAKAEFVREAVEAHKMRTAEARQRIPDYDKTLASYAGPAPTDALATMIVESDKSELLALHFASRPELVRELNQMSPTAAARRVGQIEARLSYPTAKTASNAPPPVGALKGGASPTRDPSNMSHDEFKRMFART